MDAFTSDQILLGHIRYIHNIDFPVHDEFKVSIALQKQFPIQINQHL